MQGALSNFVWLTAVDVAEIGDQLLYDGTEKADQSLQDDGRRTMGGEDGQGFQDWFSLERELKRELLFERKEIIVRGSIALIP